MPRRTGRTSGGGQDFSVEINPGDMSRLLRDVKAFDQNLAKATRKRLRDAATPAVKDVRQRVLTGTSHSNVGLRKGIAAGVKVSIRTGARTAGVSIVATGAKLPEGKKGMVFAYDKRSFRHPVFKTTRRNVWVNQRGRPFFGAVLEERKSSMAAAMELALKDAAATIRAGDPT